MWSSAFVPSGIVALLGLASTWSPLWSSVPLLPAPQCECDCKCAVECPAASPSFLNILLTILNAVFAGVSAVCGVARLWSGRRVGHAAPAASNSLALPAAAPPSGAASPALPASAPALELEVEQSRRVERYYAEEARAQVAKARARVSQHG